VKPIFCGKDGEWKDELRTRLKGGEHVTLLALGAVKLDILAYLNSRKDLEVISVEASERSKGVSLKIKVIQKFVMEKKLSDFRRGQKFAKKVDQIVQKMPLVRPRERKVTWLLKKDRFCRKCGATFPKGSSVGKFLRHVQDCGKARC
jgi:hypothetical protein